MCKRYVGSLKYQIVPNRKISYSNPLPVSHEEEEFSVKLEKGFFYFRFKVHQTSLETAKRMAENFLEAWKIKTALESEHGEFNYKFQSSCFWLKNKSAQPQMVILDGTGQIIGDGKVEAPELKLNYPPAPLGFKLSTDVEALWQRYQNYQKAREPIQSMAYFVHTFVTWKFDKNENRAACHLRLRREVLKTLRHLSSERGDLLTVRKVTGNHKPLSEIEITWLEQVIKRLIYRVGEYDYWAEKCDNPDENLTEINMSHLPGLS